MIPRKSIDPENEIIIAWSYLILLLDPFSLFLSSFDNNSPRFRPGVFTMFTLWKKLPLFDREDRKKQKLRTEILCQSSVNKKSKKPPRVSIQIIKTITTGDTRLSSLHILWVLDVKV